MPGSSHSHSDAQDEWLFTRKTENGPLHIRCRMNRHGTYSVELRNNKSRRWRSYDIIAKTPLAALQAMLESEGLAAANGDGDHGKIQP